MTQPLWRQRLVVSVVGAVAVLGCSHSSHRCDCVSAVRSTVVMLPAAAPATAATAKPVTEPVETTSAKNDTMLETTAAKRSEPPPATIAVPIVAGPSLGSKTGTVELTAADAEAMGVKPGYTPGAIFMPPK